MFRAEWGETNVGRRKNKTKVLHFPRNAILLTFRRSQKKVQKRESFFGGGKTASLFFIIHSPNAHVQLYAIGRKGTLTPVPPTLTRKLRCEIRQIRNQQVFHKCPFKIVVFLSPKICGNRFSGEKGAHVSACLIKFCHHFRRICRMNEPKEERREETHLKN